MSFLSDQAKQLAKSGKLPDQRRVTSSKYINFFLHYECDAGNILDPMILRIIEEIEDTEWELPPSKNGRYPRKKKRPKDPDRRFKNAVRIIILNLLQLSEIRNHDIYLAVSKDANLYILKDRYSPHDMTYDPFIEAYEGLERLGYFNLVHEGFYDHSEGGGLCTRISASEYLVDLYEDAKDKNWITFITKKAISKEKDELIILKGPKLGKKGIIAKLPYKDDKFTNKARRNLKNINKVLSKHKIALDCDKKTYKKLIQALRNKLTDDPEQQMYLDLSAVKLYRIFSDGSFKRGGRFYRGWWQ